MCAQISGHSNADQGLGKITPCLWFDTQGEEAANFYVSLFEDSRILNIVRLSEPMAIANEHNIGSVLVVDFVIAGQKFMCLNGGPAYKITPAVSLMVSCDTQEELDRFWDKFAEEGTVRECGWVTDKFGVSWQVVPSVLGELLSSEEPGKTERVLNAVWKMVKLDIKTLEEA